MTYPNIRRRAFIAAWIALWISTASSQISVVGQLTDDRFVVLGTQYDGTITIRNDSDAPQDVKVYQTDYFFRSDGTTLYDEPGTVPRSNARWISFTPSVLRLDPHVTGTVNYSVAVPDSTEGGTISGSYWSLLMVEGIAPGSPESPQPRPAEQTTMGVSQLIRYGVQIASHITGTGKKDVRFLDVRVRAEEDGSKQLIVDLQNAGDLWFRPTFSAEVFDDSGNSKGVFEGSLFRMYPGTSVRQMLDVGKLARGTYTVVFIVDAGGEDVFGAEYTLTL